MYQLKLFNTIIKSARIVGDVQIYPHGDQAMATVLSEWLKVFQQELNRWSGNFGNIDGDNPAAMRYTEARLEQYANYLI